MLRVFSSRLRVATTLALLLPLVPACTASAQPPEQRVSAADSARADTGSEHASRVFLRRDLWIAGATAATAVMLLPLDEMITEEFRGAAPQRSAFLSRGARAFNSLGGSEALIVGVGMYGLGRVTGARRMASLGAHLTEAIVVSGAATAMLKGLAGRQRPSFGEGDSDEFGFGRGFGNGGLSSFPSGHATAAFAAAATITAEIDHSSRLAARIVAPLLFGGAAMVGLARIYDNKHWASDVVVGAGIGTFSGLVVVRQAYAHPDGRLERWLGIAVPSVGVGSRGSLTMTWDVTRRDGR